MTLTDYLQSFKPLEAEKTLSPERVELICRHNATLIRLVEEMQRALEQVKDEVGAIRTSQHIGEPRHFIDAMWSALDASTEALARVEGIVGELSSGSLLMR